MKKYFLSLLVVVVLTLPAQAQKKWFEGEFTLTTYTHGANGAKAKEEGSIKIITDGTLIRVNGMPEVGGIEMLTSGGVDHMLFRSQELDVVFVSKGSNEHLRLRKADIDGMMQMMSMGRQPASVQEEVKVQKTNEKRTIQGYATTKHILSNPKDGSKSNVWIADDFSINWSWIGSLLGDDFPGVPATSLSKSLNNAVPLLMEMVVNDKVVNSVEITQLKKGKPTSDQLGLAANARLLSLQDMIMKQMMQGAQPNIRGQ